MRGTLVAAWQAFDGTGLIPTYAGNTPDRRAPGLTVRAHPHVCGEHLWE